MVINWGKIRGFRKKEEQLATISQGISELYLDLDMNEAAKYLEEHKSNLLNKPFRIMVMGKSFNGKSSVVNALLGENYLPTYLLSSLATNTVIKYGESKEVILYFPNMLQEPETTDFFPVKIINHLRKYGLKNLPPLHINYSELNDYLSGIVSGKYSSMWQYQLYEKIELVGSCSILKDGFEIFIMPSLDNDILNKQSITEILSKADALLFVLAADHLCSKDEMDFLKEYLVSREVKSTFFVVNRYDLIPKQHKEDIKKFAYIKLSDYTTNEILFISALQAIEGIEKSDENLYDKSCIGLLASKLEEFLLQSIGSNYSLQFGRILNHCLKSICKITSDQSAALDSSIYDLTKHFETAKIKLRELSLEKELTVDKITLMKENLVNEITSVLKQHFVNMESRLRELITDYEPKNKLGIIMMKKDIIIVCNEILEFANEQILELNERFVKKEWLPSLNKLIRQFIDKTCRSMKELESELVNKSGIQGSLEFNQVLSYNYEVPSPYINMHPHKIPTLFVPLIFVRKTNKLQNIKDVISVHLINQFRISAEEITANIIEKINNILDDSMEFVINNINQEIIQTEKQIKDISDCLQKQMDSIKIREKNLQVYGSKSLALVEQLDELIFDL